MTSNDWAASALKWWQDAGVDTIVGEEPHDWLNPKPTVAAPGPVGEAVAAPPVEVMPDTLAAFQDWLLTAASLPFAAPLASRVAPVGDPASGLMVMVGCSFVIALVIQKTRIFVFFGGSIEKLFLLAAGVFALLKWGTYMLFRRRDEPKELPPKFPGT